MKEFTIQNEKEFELAIRRLNRWYELRDQARSELTLQSEERAYLTESDDAMIESYRYAVRDYLDAVSQRKSQEREVANSTIQDPVLSRAA